MWETIATQALQLKERVFQNNLQREAFPLGDFSPITTVTVPEERCVCFR